MTTHVDYIFTLEDLCDFADHMKAITLRALVRDGLVDAQVADDWAKTHTLIGRKKNIFRTVSNLWNEAEESNGNYWLIVGL